MSAISNAIERVIRQEQAAFGRRLADLHAAIAVFSVLVVIWSVLRSDGERYLPTILGAVGMIVVAIALRIASRRPKLAPHLGWVLPLVDAPIMASAQIAQVDSLPVPLMSLSAVLGIAAAICALSALALSYRVVLTTVAITGIHILVRNVVLDVDPLIITLCMAAWVSLGASLAILVSRITRLVTESRREDLLGKYVLGRRLGAGGMAEVYEATYSPEGGFERRVAIKKILPNYAEQPEAVELFRREAEIGAQLAHPNIVQILDFGAMAETYFLAMEYIDGAPLNTVLLTARRKGRPLPFVVATYVAYEIADALAYVHNRRAPDGSLLGLIHRDVNPPNVMITRAGDVKLADFGIARTSYDASLTAAGMFRGKVTYAAPEQLRSKTFDGRADLYALGVMLYEMLTGSVMYPRSVDVEVVQAILKGSFLPPSAVRPEIGADLERIVMDLLAAEPEARTPTGEAARRQLEALPAAMFDLVAGRRALGELVIAATAARAAAGTPDVANADGSTAKTRGIATG